MTRTPQTPFASAAALAAHPPPASSSPPASASAPPGRLESVDPIGQSLRHVTVTSSAVSFTTLALLVPGSPASITAFNPTALASPQEQALTRFVPPRLPASPAAPPPPLPRPTTCTPASQRLVRARFVLPRLSYLPDVLLPSPTASTSYAPSHSCNNDTVLSTLSHGWLTTAHNRNPYSVRAAGRGRYPAFPSPLPDLVDCPLLYTTTTVRPRVLVSFLVSLHVLLLLWWYVQHSTP
jgi:hypothetical protein